MDHITAAWAFLFYSQVQEVGCESEVHEDLGSGSAWQYYYTYTSSINSQTFWPSVHNTNYRWRVRAQNDYDWGAWSAYADFYFD